MILVLAGIIAVACGDGAGGTLEAVIDPEGETSGFASFTQGTDKGFGIFVCSTGGPVTIESIEPGHVEGEVEFLGSLVYTAEDRFVGAAHGWPPHGLDLSQTEPLEDATVDIECDSPSGDDRVQLLIGAQRTGPGGGVIDGLRVTTDGGKLEIPYTILLCGDEMQYCEVLVPEEGTGPSTTSEREG